MDTRAHYQAEEGGPLLDFLRRLPPIYEQRLSTTLRLLDRWQQAQDMQRVLGMERAECQTTMEGVTLRWEELCAQEAELRTYLLTFQHYIVENEVKCKQAVEKVKRAQEICHQKEQQLRLLQEERQLLIKRKRQIQSQIQHYSKFCDYLESTVEASEEFQVPGDVLSRFHTLVATSHNLRPVVQEAQAAIARAKGQLSGFLEEKSDEVVQLNNQLGKLQATLEQAQNRRLVWDSHWAHIQNTATKKTLLIGTIKMATLNLVQCVPPLDRSAATDDIIRQLEMVQRYIQHLTDIYEATRHRPKSESSQHSLTQK